MKNNAYLFTESGICVFTGGEQFTVSNDHPSLQKIKDCISEGRFEDIKKLVDVRSSVSSWISNGRDFELKNDSISLNGKPFDSAVTNKVLSMMAAGHTAEPLYAFLRKVRQNPSKVAQSELLLFCIANNFMIHEDGDIVAYKGVRDNFKDIHSGTIDNSVGKTVTMERGEVDDERERTCSTGLHFASHGYASTWTTVGHVMVMKINPRDVVSIPSDYSNQKGRCCRYVVLAELKQTDKPLAQKEVYSYSDLGAEDSIESEQDEYERERLEAELARKERVKSVWVRKLAETPSWMNYSKNTKLRDSIKTIEDEIDELNDDLDNLGNAAEDDLFDDDFDDDDNF
jgi:hypothetical protein